LFQIWFVISVPPASLVNSAIMSTNLMYRWWENRQRDRGLASYYGNEFAKHFTPMAVSGPAYGTALLFLE